MNIFDDTIPMAERQRLDKGNLLVCLSHSDLYFFLVLSVEPFITVYDGGRKRILYFSWEFLKNNARQVI